MATVPEVIQVIGRLRSKPLYVLFLSGDRDGGYDESVDVGECIKKQICQFYLLKWNGHFNCCGVQNAHGETRDIVKVMVQALGAAFKRRRVEESAQEQESDLEQAKRKLEELDKKYTFISIDNLHLWFKFYKTTLEGNPVVRVEGVCDWCFMNDEECSRNCCEGYKVVHQSLACRIIFGGMSGDEVCEVVQYGQDDSRV